MILSNDPMGSYAVEAFLKSRSVSSENKHMFIEKLKVMITTSFFFSFLLFY